MHSGSLQNLRIHAKLEMAVPDLPVGGIRRAWVKPRTVKKKLVWTEVRVKEGSSNLKLVKPSDITGPFQIYQNRQTSVQRLIISLPHFYKDIAVIAFRLPERDKSLSDLGQ
jgi:hypothetical protein